MLVRRLDINILRPDIDILWLDINILRLDRRATEWQLALASVFFLLTTSIFPDFCKIVFLHPVNLHFTALSVNAYWRNIVQKHIILIKSGSYLLYFLCRFCIFSCQWLQNQYARVTKRPCLFQKYWCQPCLLNDSILLVIVR